MMENMEEFCGKSRVSEAYVSVSGSSATYAGASS